MNIAIIGGGLTGLTAAYELLKNGHRVTVFEKEKKLGGLAGGFRQSDWKWSLEKTYHHFFTNDDTIISLAKELGLKKDIIIKRPVTATLVSENSDNSENQKNQTFRLSESLKFRPSDVPSFLSIPKRPSFPAIYQLDSPMNLLTFPLLSPVDKLRTAGLLAFCKLNPFWQPLEKITAEQLFKTVGGTRAWDILWQPLMIGKFGKYANTVPASWLWARIKKRTPSLGYFRGGFQTLVDTLAEAIIKKGGIINLRSDITSIKNESGIRNKELGKNKKNNTPYSSFIIHNSQFDTVLLTTPSSTAVRLLHPLSIRNPKFAIYNQRLLSIPHLWAQTLILETKEPILEKTYWLNVVDAEFSFIAVVAHTNYMDKKYYGGRHITYIGNYLPDGHPYLKMTKQQLLKTFLPYLKKINPNIHHSSFIIHYSLFTAPAAQPVHTLNYSQKTPEIKTPIEGIYLANLDSICPWDRGTNYAVELGKKAAKKIDKA